MTQPPIVSRPADPIPALQSASKGHQFVIYGDACSGVPGAPHEATFAAVNAIVRRLEPQPEFIIFPGDEIIGLTPDEHALRAQWQHWLGHEMDWHDRSAIPMWHTTGNHTAYDAMSERVFRDVLAMPQNGPPGQEGLSYWVRRGDLLMVFVHTLWTGLGGEGFVETEWLGRVLAANADATHKLVVGHHPVHSVNGFSGAYQRDIGPASAANFWSLLVHHGVRAYICSHILAFDVQVHDGVLQLCSAGAGTAHRMPEGVEYLHCVQAALDADRLRYQVLDVEGRVRETLDWPWRDEQRDAEGETLPSGNFAAPVSFPSPFRRIDLRLRGHTAPATDGRAQTIVAFDRPGALPPFWLGLRGPQQQLTAILHAEPGRSPHYWLGPSLPPAAPFDLRVALDAQMGPGGIMCQQSGRAGWTSLSAASAWGLERLSPSDRWSVGSAPGGADDRPFRGSALSVSWLASS